MNLLKQQKNKLIIAITMFCILGCFFVVHETKAVSTDNHNFPRIANQYLKTPLSNSEVESLAKWDVLILGLANQISCPEQLRRIREFNPDVVILTYIPSQEFPLSTYEMMDSYDKNGLWHQLYNGIDEDWWLYRPDGSHFSSWPGNWSLNVTNVASQVNGDRWNTYLPEFVKNNVMSSGLWDGIFYDNAWPDVHWVDDGQMDFNQDGKVDSTTYMNTNWLSGMTTLISHTRSILGDDAVIIGNGGDEYSDYMNGRMYESFPNPWFGGWEGELDAYIQFMENGFSPTMSIINRAPNNYDKTDYQTLRYYLGSTLMADGYFAFNKAPISLTELWWYDEYNLSLGEPTGRAYNTLNTTHPFTVQEGVWRRNYEEGIVLLNSTSTVRKISLDGPYEKIRGLQDPAINTGEVVTSVTLQPEDAIIMLTRLDEVNGVTFQNGSYAKVWDSTGRETRNPFYSYDPNFQGGTQVVSYDLDNDGNTETVVADDTRVWVYDSQGALMYNFCPYTCNFDKGINLAVGDLNKDKQAEIVTGTKLGGGPHVMIFNNVGHLIRPGFFAYAENFRGGVQVAIADLDGDGLYEIVVGAGYGGGPHVRVFDRYGELQDPGFFAYDPKFRGGVNIAVGDIDGDGSDEIVTGAGPGGGPHVRMFNKRGKLINPGFMAYDLSYRNGVRVQILDIDGNGINDILTMTQIGKLSYNSNSVTSINRYNDQGVSIKSYASYYNNSNNQLGYGSITPVAGNSSAYRVYFEVENSEELKNFKLVSSLPSQVTWKGRESLTYNGSLNYIGLTRDVVWEIDNIKENSGIIQTSFEVEVLPNIYQIDKRINLVNSSIIYIDNKENISLEALSINEVVT